MPKVIRAPRPSGSRPSCRIYPSASRSATKVARRLVQPSESTAASSQAAPNCRKTRGERERKQSLFWVPADTDLQGTRLLDRNLPVNLEILKFLKRRLLWKQEDFPWSERKSLIGK